MQPFFKERITNSILKASKIIQRTLIIPVVECTTPSVSLQLQSHCFIDDLFKVSLQLFIGGDSTLGLDDDHEGKARLLHFVNQFKGLFAA
jgi:hypothetical protein